VGVAKLEDGEGSVGEDDYTRRRLKRPKVL